MPSHIKRSSRGGSSSVQPPSYRSDYGRTTEDLQEEAIRRRMSYMVPADSSRAIANGGELATESAENGAGIGAGRNAYMAPDTPSQYTDPYEYNSTVVGVSRRPEAGANVLSTRPDANFLAYDPYMQSGSQSLHRSNTLGTLGPNDSVSAYNVNAISRNMTSEGHRPGLSYDPDYDVGHYPDAQQQQHGTADETHDYYDQSYAGHDPSYGGHHQFEASADDVPLRGYPADMGYAEDEAEEMKQREAYWNAYSQDIDWDRKHAPSLFANNLQQPPAAMRKSLEEGSDDRKGLLARMPYRSAGGVKTGWGGTLDEQIERRKRGVGRQRWPILSWILSVAYVAVFIVELVKGKQQTGQAIQTSPSWNPMLGPSFEFLISFGARFVPCMRNVPQVPTSTQLACLRYSTSSTLSSNQLCPIWEVCGLPNATTFNQSWRFVTPIFIHAGIIHIAFNLLVQLTLCAQIEKLISTPFYAIVYFAGGIGGCLLGGNFGLVGQPSVGASGAIYTCISMEVVDLCYNWKYEYRPRMRLFVSVVFAIIGFAIGLLPGLDNFAHVGGFAVGLLGGLLFCPSIHATKRHQIITWVLRIIALGLLVGFFVGLTTNFYSSADPTQACPWCRYLSCLPLFSQCKGNGLTTTTTSTSPT